MKTITIKRVMLPLLTLLIVGCISPSVDEKEAKKLAEELFNHPEINEIDDCTRSQKYVNGKRILLEQDMTKEVKNDYLLVKPKYFRDALNEEGIKEEDFEYFKRRLKETRLRHYFKKGNYSVFVTGGILGDINGILVVHKNDTIPENGFHLNEQYYISIGDEIDTGVFWIRG